jgi:ligand-binding sensor domain-containing protein
MVISEDFRKDQYILKPIISILIFAIVLTLPSLLITEAATINLGYDETEPVNYAKLQTPQSSNAWRTYINANNVSNLAVEGDYVWATTSGTGVVRWHPVDSTYVRYTTNDGLVSNVVSTVAIDGMEHKWFGTNGGVNEFDDTHWITYTVGNSGLVSNLVSAIAIDSEGNKWFGTAGGVSKLDNANSWTTYTISNSGLVNNFVFAIAIDNGGNKWFGTAGGVSKLDNTNN